LLDMCNSRGARAGGSVRPGRALEAQARRANVGEGREKVRRTRRRGDRPAPVTGKQIESAATVRPRVRTRGVTDNLLRPRHDDPETRRTRTSSPFEGRRQSANVSQALAIAGLGPARRIVRIRPRTRCITLLRNTKKATNGQKCAYAMRQSTFVVVLRRAALPRIEGADDAVTPRMQNMSYIGARMRVGKRIPRGRSGGPTAKPVSSKFRAAAASG
jgi:hypothetical protein